MTRRRALVSGILAVGVFAAALALWSAVEGSDTDLLPPAWRWPVAGVFSLVSLLAAGRGWVELLDPDEDRSQLAGALYLSQLTKYLPGGGIFQAGSVIALSRRDDVPLARAGVAMPVSALLTVLACLTIGSGAALAETSLPTWARVLASFGVLAPLAAYRPISAAVLDGARRIITRLPATEHLPAQAAIARSLGWTLVSVAATSVSYAMLAAPLVDRGAAAITVAFALAWLAGYLVVPLPGGLGVREAVLVGLVGGAAAPVIAASVAHRIVTICAELVTVSGHMARRRRR